MEGELHNNTIVHDQEDSISTPENVADSPLSGDGAADLIAAAPPPKKRKGAQKRVVSVPIGGADGSPKTKGEVYPPPDSWSWRKYGQKPIKGSPYPRGYYRCSSSKGCPSRKQVERSRVDPTMLLITYSHEHNHSLPATKKHHHHRSAPTTVATSSATTSTSSNTTTTTTTGTTDAIPTQSPPEEFAIFTNQPDLDLDNSGFSDLTSEFGWFSNLGSTTMLETPTFVGSKWADADVAVMLPIGEEDQSLFGDLGELPECSMVFRHQHSVTTPCYGGTR